MFSQWSSEQLNTIESTTLGHYNSNAKSFWEGTKDHDVSQNIEAFLSACPQGESLDILDFGCAAGRDVRFFQSLGHRPVGLDGSEAFCAAARGYTGCRILQQSFLALDLPEKEFDGVFANASLFHIPSQELTRVLIDLRKTLRPNGILFSSNPRGSGEGWQGQRYGHYTEFEASKSYLRSAGFDVLHHYYRPAGKPRHEQPWLAIVSRSVSDETPSTSPPESTS